MTSITHFPFFSHLRAEPNQFILHDRAGRIVRTGAGQAYWFLPLSAAIAQLPVEDVETTFVLTERTADYQDVSVQCTLTYRLRVGGQEDVSPHIRYAVYFRLSHVEHDAIHWECMTDIWHEWEGARDVLGAVR